MAFSVPGLIAVNELNPARGWPNDNPLECFARKDAAVLYSLRAGQCVHLNTALAYEPGVQLTQMAIFLMQGSADPDTLITGNAEYSPVTPYGNIQGLVATGAYELETTEFVTSLTYTTNQPLRSPVGNAGSNESGSTASGVLRNDTITLYTTAVVGVVSRGVFTNKKGMSVLAFWPVYCPGTA